MELEGLPGTSDSSFDVFLEPILKPTPQPSVVSPSPPKPNSSRDAVERNSRRCPVERGRSEGQEGSLGRVCSFFSLDSRASDVLWSNRTGRAKGRVKGKGCRRTVERVRRGDRPMGRVQILAARG